MGKRYELSKIPRSSYPRDAQEPTVYRRKPHIIDQFIGLRLGKPDGDELMERVSTKREEEKHWSS